MRNFFRKLHLWASVPLGLVLVVTCFTGAMLVFEDEITALCNSEMVAVEPVGEPLSLECLVKAVEKELPADVEVTGITLSATADEAYKVNLSKPKRAAVYVNQYTGEVRGNSERLPFFQSVLRLHRWLMDTAPEGGGVYWGKMIVGASTMAFVLVLLTGLFLWWPRNRKMFANRVRIALNKEKKRFWYDLHVAGGFYALLLLLVMALTGLTWSYEWYRNGFYSLFGAAENKGAAVASTKVVKGNAPKFSSTKDKKDSAVDATTAATVSSWSADAVTGATVVEEQSKTALWEKAVAHVLKENPGFANITVSDGSVTVKNGSWGNQRASDKYMFDESTGEITSVQRYNDATAQSRVSGWVYSLHTGSWGGMVIKVLYFLAALLGAALPLTGYYLWIKRLCGKRRK